MLVIRNVFQARYGQGGQLVALLKESRSFLPDEPTLRILSDASGQFDTIVTERILESFADYERRRSATFSRPEFAAWFERFQAVVVSGRREFYYIEAEV